MNGDGASYRLNFGGEIKQNTILNIGMAVSRVEVFIAPGTAVKVTAANPPVSSSADEFSHAEKAYWNGPA